MTVGHLPAWARRRRHDVVDPRILESLAAAMSAGDDDGIRAVLRSDAQLVIDSGRALPSPLPGEPPGAPPGSRERAVAGLRALMASGATIMTASVNSVPGLVLVRQDTVVGVMTAQTRDRLLADIWVVCNPDKLRHWNR